MKLLEAAKELDGSIQNAIQQMVNDMFQEELDDDVIDDIVNNLSLTDVLELDKAYANGDEEKVRELLGPLPQLEYAVQQGRQPASAASNRPAPARREQPAPAASQTTNNNVTQKDSPYSTGAQNAVTTTRVDNVDGDDEEAMATEEISTIKALAGLK